jgi:hypothetical protein
MSFYSTTTSYFSCGPDGVAAVIAVSYRKEARMQLAVGTAITVWL